ncbi:MAG: trypsin-like peptidase domain-containing protein [Planctomycetes bacterium]|nr:trypsin-like peptidase domain-containing protein [Planctomycetota bacterium]
MSPNTRLNAERAKLLSEVGRTAVKHGIPERAAREEIVDLNRMLKERRAALQKIDSQWRGSGRVALSRSALGVAILGVVLCCGAGLAVRASVNWVMHRGPLADLRNENQLNDAVALVVTGAHVTDAAGAEVELAQCTGTGFLVTADGYLLTNRHVVNETWGLTRAEHVLERLRNVELLDVKPSVWVFLEGRKFPAEISHVSDKYDLAILKIDRKRGPYFCLSAEESVPRQTQVRALGFPADVNIPFDEIDSANRFARQRGATKVEDNFDESDFVFTSTAGCVSRPKTDHKNVHWLQHDARISQGNSGGPLVDGRAVVVGINTLGTESGIYFAATMPQMRAELEEHIPGLVWE